MHFFFYARGVTHQFEIWKTLAQCQFFKWRRLNKNTNEKELSLVQGALRPSVLGAWEFVFPKEALADVVSIFALSEEGFRGLGLRLPLLRKIFKAKKIPTKFYKEAEKLPSTIIFDKSERGLSSLVLSGVTIHPIGIKEDRMGEILDKYTGITYIQELL